MTTRRPRIHGWILPSLGLAMAATGLLTLVLLPSGNARRARATLACEPAESSEPPTERGGEETAAVPLRVGSRALVEPEAVASLGALSTDTSFEERYAGWDTEAIRIRYDELVVQFVDELERAVAPRFGSGNYRLFLRGDVRPPHDRIHAVRTRRDGIYEEVVLEPAEAPAVYALQAEAAWLSDRLDGAAEG